MAESYLNFVQKTLAITLDLFSLDELQNVKLEGPDTNELNQKISVAAKKGNLIPAKGHIKDNEVHLATKGEEVKSLIDRGLVPRLHHIDSKGEHTVKSLKDHDIVHHKLSNEEHARILGAGQSALDNLARAYQEREARAEEELKEEQAYFDKIHATKQKETSKSRFLANAIFNANKKNTTQERIREEQLKEEANITEEHLQKEREEKAIKFERKMTKDQINSIQQKEEMRKEDEKKIDQRRERRAREGELIQMDASDHKWFKDRGPR